MINSILEHINVTVTNPEKTAQVICDLFDWQVRWKGDAIHGGLSIHVGEKNSYIAIYAPATGIAPAPNSYETLAGLNHIAFVVDDLEEVEKRVINAGYEPHSHADYEPGRRFYFRDENEIEFEVVSYDN